ncbi:MAG: tRNA (cytidine(56)-2'-O)-methyltransferase [Candidatus Helarchaeota archaeon]|nr:tRNA (cytidine(56)-2'-O)-methyltransferase [Candidatus Helarchaeota archaeon]
MKLVVLRMGHRFERDKRITTHIALVARAFGANGIIIGDVKDSEVQNAIEDVSDRFGGNFSLEMGKNSLKILKEWKKSGGEIIHLTMYGIPLPNLIEEIRNSQKDKLVVVGAKKVPKEVYDLATYNVSITNQPHSEIAALAIFLDHFFLGEEFNKKHKNAKLEIIPSKNKKILRKLDEDED